MEVACLPAGVSYKNVGAIKKNQKTAS